MILPQAQIVKSEIDLVLDFELRSPQIVEWPCVVVYASGNGACREL